MSTRYVWEKSNVERGLIKQTERDYSYTKNNYGVLPAYMYYHVADAISINDDLTIDLVNPETRTTQNNPINVGQYVAAGYTDNDVVEVVTEQILETHTASPPFIITVVGKANVCYAGYVKGDGIGEASSVNSGAYPTDGETAGFYYEFKGTDTIDPSSVSSPPDPRGGQNTTVTVSPGTGKIYGGTVSYRYEYSTNGGQSWTLAQTTTATSVQISIPEGVETFRARVRAQDDIGFTSADYVYSTQVTVINNEPPTAPSSISVGPTVAGETVTVNLGAATDPDGQVVSYIYERSIDGGQWVQVHQGNTLAYTDTIGAEWATVAYRAKAVDDDGEAGPYATSEASVVNDGWLYISGPAENMGSKPAPFVFEVSAGVSGQSGVSGIGLVVTLDGVSVYDDAVSDTDLVEIEMDTRLMGEGTHTIAVEATKEDFIPTYKAFSFSVPAFTLPDGGRMEQLEGTDGSAIFPVTLARAVIGYNGRSVEDLLEDVMVSSLAGAKIASGSYSGSGTFGADTPRLLAFTFPVKALFVCDNTGAVTLMIPDAGAYVPRMAGSGSGVVSGSGTTVSWYSSNAEDQLNASGKRYSYVAVG